MDNKNIQHTLLPSEKCDVLVPSFALGDPVLPTTDATEKISCQYSEALSINLFTFWTSAWKKAPSDNLK